MKKSSRARIRSRLYQYTEKAQDAINACFILFHRKIYGIRQTVKNEMAATLFLMYIRLLDQSSLAFVLDDELSFANIGGYTSMGLPISRPFLLIL